MNKLINTSKIALMVGLWGVAVSIAQGENKRIGILASKASILVFNEEIIDAELGSKEYAIKIKGRYLLLRARHQRVKPTSLFVRYGKQKHGYVAEILLDENAPLQQYIEQEEQAYKEEVQPPQEEVFEENQPQEYCIYGAQEHDVQVILTNIAHTKQATHLRCFIENNSSIDLALTYWNFEYITILKKFPRKTKRKLVEPTKAPNTIQVLANTGGYFVFSLPTYAVNGGMEVFLGEDAGERAFRFYVPSKVLRKAKRK